MSYRYIPNGFATAMFNLTAACYDGDGLTTVLEDAIGTANYNKYMVAQDPFCGGQTENVIRIITNPDERDGNRMCFESIGVVQKLSDKPLRLRFK